MLKTIEIREVIEPEKLDEMLQYLNEEKRLIDNEQVELEFIILKIKSVENLFRIKTHTNKLTEIEQSDLQMHIGEIEDANQVNYAASQKKLCKRLSILR